MPDGQTDGGRKSCAMGLKFEELGVGRDVEVCRGGRKGLGV